MVAPRALVERFLQSVTAPDPGDLADCFADRVVIEMPFAPPGLVPPRLEATREELRARYAAGASVRRYTEVTDASIHETADPSTVIVEFSVRGTMLATEEEFALRFVMVMTIRDGRITHTRDYADPIAGARALGRLPELVTSLSG
ncbi:MAG TPA: nuclear transport factor 2 family protein [Dactylosporangium sp.]|jgi:ketosteroid isomerase-like protein|nr:nuclear transport factor 2 family protein [Dactylosporangium sp.]